MLTYISRLVHQLLPFRLQLHYGLIFAVQQIDKLGFDTFFGILVNLQRLQKSTLNSLYVRIIVGYIGLSVNQRCLCVLHLIGID